MSVTLPGTGQIVASETVSSEQVQVVKPVWGADTVGNRIDRPTPLPVDDKWSTIGSGTSIFDDVGVLPTLKNLANNASVLSNEIDNTVNRFAWLALDFLVRGASAFSSGGTVAIYIIKSLDGTNYEDGSASITPASPQDVTLFLRNVNTQQRIMQAGIQIPPCKFKLLVRNTGGAAFTNTNNENALTAYLY